MNARGPQTDDAAIYIALMGSLTLITLLIIAALFGSCETHERGLFMSHCSKTQPVEKCAEAWHGKENQ